MYYLGLPFGYTLRWRMGRLYPTLTLGSACEIGDCHLAHPPNDDIFILAVKHAQDPDR